MLLLSHRLRYLLLLVPLPRKLIFSTWIRRLLLIATLVLLIFSTSILRVLECHLNLVWLIGKVLNLYLAYASTFSFIVITIVL